MATKKTDTDVLQSTLPQQTLKPVYIKAGRDLKGVESQKEFYGTEAYVFGLGYIIEFYMVQNCVISQVTKEHALSAVMLYEQAKKEEEARKKAEKEAKA